MQSFCRGDRGCKPDKKPLCRPRACPGHRHEPEPTDYRCERPPSHMEKRATPPLVGLAKVSDVFDRADGARRTSDPQPRIVMDDESGWCLRICGWRQCPGGQEHERKIPNEFPQSSVHKSDG